MRRPSAIALVLLVTPCFAGEDASTRIRHVGGPVRDAGVYHPATDSWTRKASLAGIGADIVYNNTASSGYFMALSGDVVVDEGRLPSPSSPTSIASRPGCQTAYAVDGVQFAYCTDQANGGAFTLAFYESYVPCSTVVGATPQGTVAMNGPGSSGSALACWTVTVDLDTPPASFTMRADGDGTYGGAADTFGWRIESTLPSGSQLATGPVLAGDPNVALRWDGTRWDHPVNYAEAGTGMGTTDQFRLEGAVPGCYFFGAIPFASFHLEVYADACGICLLACSPTFCFGDGTGTPCPCGNNGIPGNGCANSLFAAGANLGASGVPSIGLDTVFLTSTNTPNASVLFFQGTIQQAGGAGAHFGDGKRCAGGTTVRIGTKTASSNTAWYPGPGDAPISVRGGITTPGVRTYQAWYRNAAAFCTPATFNLSNGLEIAWGA